MSRVRRNAEGFLKTEQWKCQSYAATDVFVLLLAFSSSIDASLFQKCGTQTRTRLTDISKLVATIGKDVCQALIGLHSFT